MRLLDVKLTAKRGNWQRFVARRKKPKFKELEKTILARDDCTCQYCGFRSDKFQLVLNKNQNYSPAHTIISNMVTSCIFCAQCFFLDGIGTTKATGGWLIYLPEISQANLNNFVRVMFTSMLNDAPYRGKLHTTYLSLKDRTKEIDDVFGSTSHDPFTFGQSIIDCNFSEDELNLPLMQNIRLLPDRKCFTRQIDYWKKTVFADIPL